MQQFVHRSLQEALPIRQEGDRQARFRLEIVFMSLIAIETFVHVLADRSAAAILPFFRTSLGAHDKSGGRAFDPVTEADKAAEVIIRRLINERFPDHGIDGEEFGAHKTDAEYCWSIDPIDGTKAFICGLPVWGTLIGLMRSGSPVLGLMNQPFTGERFWGDGKRAFWRGADGKEKSLRARDCGDLAHATLMTTTPKMFKGEMAKAYARLERNVRLARYGCDCYAYCMLAAGHIDLVVEAGLKSVDIIPLVPILRGAGCIVTNFDGEEPGKGGTVIAAATAALHADALRLLKGRSAG